MLFNLLLVVPGLVLGGSEFGFPTFQILDRFTIPINQCFENVTRTSAGGEFSDGGSMYCMCSEGDTLTESGFSCFYYNEGGCTGDSVVEEHWGGCDTFTRQISTVQGCSTAQAYLAEDGDCPYWIRDYTTSTMQRKIYPLETCFDYWCNDNLNDDTARSCKMECDDNGDITQAENSDYECNDLEDNSCSFCGDVNNKKCGSTGTSSASCSVIVTTWDVIGDSQFECGSKSGKNNFKTSKKKLKSNYIMLDNNETPYPIEQCAQVRYGYYSYSYQYKCSDDGTTVMLYHYLNDDGDCDDKDLDNRYLIETYVSSNTTFKCDGSDSTGKIGYYEECDDYNWDAKYYEYLTLFGECVPLKSNPLSEETPYDDNPSSAQPWYENLRVVMSCNLNERGKTYPSVYLYVTEDCSGDYLFRWDWDNYYGQLSNYGVQKCSIPQISGCSNGLDGVRRGNLPTKEYVCK